MRLLNHRVVVSRLVVLIMLNDIYLMSNIGGTILMFVAALSYLSLFMFMYTS
jgi:hypothetical protein